MRAQHLLLEAATDAREWRRALEAIADACSARMGQLICSGADGAIRFNLLTGATPDAADVAAASGLGDAAANPRLRAGLTAPAMVPVADQHYANAELRRQSPIYGEFFEPYDLYYNCQAVLLRRDDMMVRMSVTRTRAEGMLDDAAFAAFRELMPMARAAVRLQAAVETAGVNGMIHSFDATGQAALLLDACGRLIRASREGEALLTQGDCLSVRGGHVVAQAADDAVALARLIAGALAQKAPLPVAPPPILLRSTDGKCALTVEAQPLPRDRALFGQGAALLALLMPYTDDTARTAILQQDFGLTSAEAGVALLLARGQRPSAIARSRGVALPTVRSQVAAIYAKLGIHGQVELAALLRALDARAGRA